MSSATELLAGGSVLLLLGLATGERLQRLPTAQALLALVYLIIFGSLLAFSAYGYLLRNTRPALATSHAYVNPAVAVALGYGWIANDHLDWQAFDAGDARRGESGGAEARVAHA